ncbi:MAG: transcriptional activator NhaR [Myxococcales bacterium]|nr:transcriptional activator NhaR [Myxococcales bacterium]
MEWVNYHHLLYFFTVAREGGLARAGQILRLSHSTLSEQIHSLEDRLGEKLFARAGRKLVLTEMGRVVYRYAEEIFALGNEMLDTVKGRPTGLPARLNVGIVDAVPKRVVNRLLQPALRRPEAVRLVCRENSFDRLLADLSLYAFDVLIADAPVPSGSNVKAFSHLLGESGVTFFGVPRLATRLRRGFPRSLEGAPLLLHTRNTAVRRALDRWFDGNGLHPRVIAEFEDDALLSAVGATGRGLFPAPTVVEADIVRQLGVQAVGRVEQVRLHYYALSIERRIRNPFVAAICERARDELFGPD